MFLDVKFNNAVEYAFAVLVGVAVRVYGLGVLGHGEDGEEGDERYSEEGEYS